jgi:NAD(P)-dependent dehydrogenase (short-subunit alcohol dehydrogenase family)
MRLQDQVAIITGAAGAGIGQTTARRFAQEGAHIVVSDTHPRRTDEVAQAIASEWRVIGPVRRFRSTVARSCFKALRQLNPTRQGAM